MGKQGTGRIIVVDWVMEKFAEVGRSGKVFWEGIFPPYFFEWKQFARQMVFWGMESFPIALLAGAISASITSFLISESIKEAGGLGRSFVGGAVAQVMTRDLGPVLIGLILCGRVGASITSEIGSMKITEQLDALKSLGIDTFQFLVLPRCVAGILITPMLVATVIFFSVIVGYFPAKNVLDLSWFAYEYSIRTLFGQKYIRECLWKSALFGFLIALVSCHKGLAVEKGAEELGVKVTEGVVSSMVGILFMDLFLSAFYF
ncbi:MAG: MlaE family ABC transporter permease [bacterium JZ-2024 1]